uniref:Uncharacterized protein n=1 Tax=Anguilla anguilla TaxID=7936 RepID=A0A0E9QQA4_ANGAN
MDGSCGNSLPSHVIGSNIGSP